MTAAVIVIVAVWIVVAFVALARRRRRTRGPLARTSSVPWSSIVAGTMMCAGLLVVAWPTQRTHDNEAWGTGLDLMMRVSLGAVLAGVGLIWFVLSARSPRTR